MLPKKAPPRLVPLGRTWEVGQQDEKGLGAQELEHLPLSPGPAWLGAGSCSFHTWPPVCGSGDDEKAGFPNPEPVL